MEVSRVPVPRLAVGAVLTVGAVALAVIVWLTSTGSLAVWAVGGVAALSLAAALARPTPLQLLAGVLALQVFHLEGGAGTSAGEAVAGLALVGYLAYWYAATWLSGRPVVMSTFDVAALLWGTVGVVAAAVLGQVFGANAYDFRADVLATLPFLLYLPVKDVCMRHENGGLVVAGVLVGFGLYATVLNGLLLRSVIVGATEAWQIADARFGTGETSISSGLLLTFGGLAVVKNVRVRLGLLCLAGVLFGGLILTKSRGFWVSTLVGLAVLLVVVPSSERKRLAVACLLGVGALVSVALLFFGDQVALLAAGTIKRFATLSTAATSDISLLNRFVENRAVWEEIRQNPVLGYGWGVQVTHFSLISHTTTTWAFFHNGYLALWIKTGLWGLSLMMWTWIGGLVRGSLAGRASSLLPQSRSIALGASATLVAFSIVVSTSNPFSVLDQMLVVTLLLGLAHGLADRARTRALESPSGGRL